MTAIKMALKMCDHTVVEAGFGSDLGAEKFVDIVSRVGDLRVDIAVIVATIRALKLHGGASRGDPRSGSKDNMNAGIENLAKHIENIAAFGIPGIVALNVFEGDTDDEIKAVVDFCDSIKCKCSAVRVFEKGSAGAIELAEMTGAILGNEPTQMRFVYELSDSVEMKIEKIAKQIYGANRVVFTPRAEKDIKRIIKLGFDKLPVCIAKTDKSLSDNPSLLGRPKDFKITISGIRISAGAGFLVPITGEIMLMPGLAKTPNAELIDIDEQGRITGLS
jgi:formate--tetrahydrofolate ligase